MKTILIDARMYGPKHTGIGRYVKNLLLNLPKIPEFRKYKWKVMTYSDQIAEVKRDLGDNFDIFASDLGHYSVKEQLFLPQVIRKQKVDLVHFTNFNKPLLYIEKNVVTIHDLIKHFSKGKETTTRNKSWYWIKYWAYRLAVDIIIKTSRIIVPSNYWRNYIIDHYRVDPKKITTTYESVDDIFLRRLTNIINKPKNYVIYTGNVYPHKNVDVILKTLKRMPDISLKIICARSIFTERLEKKIDKMGVGNQVTILGYIKDEDFEKIYREALALVHPSLLEGFGLTGLEAMVMNCPVIAARSSCLPEIYGDSVLYFDPEDERDLEEKLDKLRKMSKLREELIKKGWEQVKKYSFVKMARETMAVYRAVLNET